MSTMFAIHSTVRSRHNRTLRAQAPAHHRMKQYVGADQARLVRGRALFMTEENLIRGLEDLKKKNKQGILEVRTMDGRIFDLDTMTAAPIAPVTPLPNPPLDSAKDDSPMVGDKIAMFPGGVPIQNLPPGSDAAEEVQIPAEFLSDEDAEEETTTTQTEIKPSTSKPKVRR